MIALTPRLYCFTDRDMLWLRQIELRLVHVSGFSESPTIIRLTQFVKVAQASLTAPNRGCAP